MKEVTDDIFDIFFRQIENEEGQSVLIVEFWDKMEIPICRFLNFFFVCVCVGKRWATRVAIHP